MTLPLPKRSAVSTASVSARTVFFAQQHAILDHGDQGGQPLCQPRLIEPMDVSLEPDAQIALLLEERRRSPPAPFSAGAGTPKVTSSVSPECVREHFLDDRLRRLRADRARTPGTCAVTTRGKSSFR